MITDYLVTIAKLPVIQRILRRITFFIQAYNLEKSTFSFEWICHSPM